ncbi:MAG TPA: hypothetical protein VGM86_30940 [Thermoanaerobaculia bacterium]|jgi:hypothetical protein
MKTQRILLFLLIALILAVTSCRSRTDKSEGTVILSVSHFNGLPVSVSATNGPFQIDQITLSSFFKDPSVQSPTGHTLEGIELRNYEITYTRRDKGTRVPPPSVQSIFGLVPPQGTLDLFNLPFMTSDQIGNPPIHDLITMGRDSETGTTVITLDVSLRFFGRTISGDDIASEPSKFTIEVTP